ncbi:MAG: hypothetical protein ACFB0G_24560 [Leptolyngbyaceae cyanobacterium]
MDTLFFGILLETLPLFDHQITDRSPLSTLINRATLSLLADQVADLASRLTWRDLSHTAIVEATV